MRTALMVAAKGNFRENYDILMKNGEPATTESRHI